MNEHKYQILKFLSTVKEATSKQIEHQLDLRQPEVSIACTELIERGWIIARRGNVDGIGKQYVIYKLKKNIPDIKNDLKIEMEEKYQSRIIEIFGILNGELKCLEE
jgi:predicted transcriptional regulator